MAGQERGLIMTDQRWEDTVYEKPEVQSCAYMKFEPSRSKERGEGEK